VTLVVGGDEVAARTVAVRRYGGAQERGVALDALVAALVAEAAAGRRGEVPPAEA
jgi:threonyl-tRNA synthetase